MAINVCLAGATGWAGSELARGIMGSADQKLSAAVSRTDAGRDASAVLGESGRGCPVFSSAAEALALPCDVFVEYTKPDVAKANILAALARGAHVVVGTSGSTDEDYLEIDDADRTSERGVLAAGNFALTAVLMQKRTRTSRSKVPKVRDRPPSPGERKLAGHWRPTMGRASANARPAGP